MPIRPFALIKLRINLPWLHHIYRIRITPLPPRAQPVGPFRYHPVGTGLGPFIDQSDQRIISPQEQTYGEENDQPDECPETSQKPRHSDRKLIYLPIHQKLTDEPTPIE